MAEVINEIEKAIKILSLTEDDIRFVEKESAEILFRDLEDRFVKSKNLRWWWEDLKDQSYLLSNDIAFLEQLSRLIPLNGRKAWLLVEDDEEPFYPIYEVKIEIIKSVIEQCYPFEYYIIDKNENWLICENHHNEFIGVGEIFKDFKPINK